MTYTISYRHGGGLMSCHADSFGELLQTLERISQESGHQTLEVSTKGDLQVTASWDTGLILGMRERARIRRCLSRQGEV